LYVLGESGAGKELAARAFHDARYASKGEAPFVAVNCAAIPEGLAERLLFGAKKGAYSGAVSDVDGYVQAADHGTLFLDEIAELDLLVQAKLLRVLESREVLPLGASQTKKVSFSVCVASHKRLRDEVSAGRFREDLYFRLGRPEVRLPPLRDRLDEIPWFVEREVRSVDEKLEASVTFFEECVRRPWPGNVRELLREVRRAAHRAVAEGSDSVEPEHLADDAGESLATPEPEPKERVSAKQWSDDEIARALDENGGNVRGTARVLGMHRNQLRRWLAKRGGGSAPNGGSTLPPSGE
jgi:transcriptional regulator with PAS, ATPase and Fis domain